MQFTRTIVLEQGNTGFHKMQSVFAMVRMWNGSIGFAYGAQLATAVGVMIALVQIWRARVADGYKKAALCLAALLITPYSMDYDLMLLAPAIALMAAEGKARGFAPYEILALTLLWCAPIAARNIAHATMIPLMVPPMLFCFGLIVWRCAVLRRQQGVSQSVKFAAW